MANSSSLNESLALNKVGNFKFSNTKLEDLGAENYTLATIAIDVSGSTSDFISEMEKALKTVVESCMLSPRADNLMIRLVTFDDNVQEIHGFKLLSYINIGDYDGVLKTGGLTALFDASENVIKASNIEGKRLLSLDYSVNGIVVVITDGCDNRSVSKAKEVAKELKESVSGENLESMLSILIEVNPNSDQSIQQELDKFFKETGFTQKENMKDLTKNGFAKLANFISKSISSQSQALNSGGASKPLTF